MDKNTEKVCRGIYEEIKKEQSDLDWSWLKQEAENLMAELYFTVFDNNQRRSNTSSFAWSSGQEEIQNPGQSEVQSQVSVQ